MTNNGIGGLMLTALVPQSALAQTPPAEAPATVHVRIEEEVASVYNATAHLNTTATGRIIANNTENRTLTNVIVRLNATTATDLPIENAIPVGELPPGERVIAEYNITTQPKLALSGTSRSITALDEVEKWFAVGEIDEVGKAIYTDPHRVVFGIDNVVEFNVTVSNVGATDLVNVVVSDLLSNATVNGSLAAVSTPSNQTDPYGGPLVYDNASDSLAIPLLRNGTSTTLTLRATVPASALADPEQDFFDLRHEIRASYAVFTEFTQEPQAGLTPEVIQQIESAKITQAVTEQEQIRQEFEPEELLEIVDGIEEARDLPNRLREEVFARAEALGIPVNNSTFADALEREVQNRTGDVLETLDHTMNYTRDRFGKFVESRAKLTGAIVREGRATQALLESLNITPNTTLIQQRIDSINATGFDANLTQFLKAQNLSDSEIEGLRQFVLSNSEVLKSGNQTNISRLVAREQWNATVAYVDAAVAALENAMFDNQVYNRTRPLLTASELSQWAFLRNQSTALVRERSWSDLGNVTGELATLMWNVALATGDFRFVDFYRNATLAKAASILALNGEGGLAEEIVAPLEFESHIRVVRLTDPVSVPQGNGATIVFGIQSTAQQLVTVEIRAYRFDSRTSQFILVDGDPCSRGAVGIVTTIQVSCTIQWSAIDQARQLGDRFWAGFDACDGFVTLPCTPQSAGFHQSGAAEPSPGFFLIDVFDGTTPPPGGGGAVLTVDSKPRGSQVTLEKPSKILTGVTRVVFTSPELEPGTYTVTLQPPAPEFEPGKLQSFTVAEGKTNFIFWNFAEKSASITFTALTVAGRPIEGATVTIRDASTQNVVSACTTGAGADEAPGSCTLTFGRGEFLVTVELSKYRKAQTVFTASPGAVFEVVNELLNDVQKRVEEAQRLEKRADAAAKATSIFGELAHLFIRQIEVRRDQGRAIVKASGSISLIRELADVTRGSVRGVESVVFKLFDDPTETVSHQLRSPVIVGGERCDVIFSQGDFTERCPSRLWSVSTVAAFGEVPGGFEYFVDVIFLKKESNVPFTIEWDAGTQPIGKRLNLMVLFERFNDKRLVPIDVDQ